MALSDLDGQTAEICPRSDTLEPHDSMSARAPSIISLKSPTRETISYPPEIIEDVYIHRIDNLLAKIHALRDASSQALKATPSKGQSLFRQGSPLAPSSNIPAHKSYAKELHGTLYITEYEKLIAEYRNRNKADRSVVLETPPDHTLSASSTRPVYDSLETEKCVATSENLGTKPANSSGFFDMYVNSSLVQTPREQREEEQNSYLSYKLQPPQFGTKQWFTSPCTPKSRESKPLSRSQEISASTTSVEQPNEIDWSLNSFETPSSYASAGELSNEARNTPFSAEAAARKSVYQDQRFQCPTCHKHVRTRSELKQVFQSPPLKNTLTIFRKHHLRHNKSFRCGFPDCTNKDGLGTANDLARHIKSKHPSFAPSEIVRRYKCHVPGCKSKDKIWPRLDNFRSHVKRIHGEEVRELGGENVVHSPGTIEEMEDGPEIEAPLQEGEKPAGNLGGLESLHVLADYAVFQEMSGQWPKKNGNTRGDII